MTTAAPPKADRRPFDERIAAYGCTKTILLNRKLEAPEQLDYLDLLPRQRNHTPALTAVAENQGTALLYLVDASSEVKSDPASISEVSCKLANRSDPAWLGVVRPGSLDVFPIGFGGSAAIQPVKTIKEHDRAAPLFFQSLVHGTFEENKRLRGTDYVFRKIFELLMQPTNEFVRKDGKGKLDALDVLSMTGRALFFRFLVDRSIVLPRECREICPAADDLKDAFSSAEKAAQTSAWLDATFNGDFLSLIDESTPASDRAGRQAAYLRFYKDKERLGGKLVFAHLHAILRGWRDVGNAFQRELEFDWSDLDFAHIPVGVLSQVYESFSHRADPRTARSTSVHYTPRTIAGLMVDEAFAALKDKAGSAMVLDPSCGAGIFLVLAFRRLVREQWQAKGRPNTEAIQDILYNQLRGFDISESALRLAALGLYITAIELNASPRPPQALRFPRNLRNTVLHRFGAGDDEERNGFPLGSLGPEVPPDFERKFDIVIGNPPWTRLREEKSEIESRTRRKTGKSTTDELNEVFTSIGKRVLAARGLSDLAKEYENPDKNPDLPFLWRAMEWARNGGVIALTMPARLFGRTTGNGYKAWRAVLRSVEMTGLINGADLRWSSVWKDVKVPFCIFFARNTKPGSDHRFYYASPINEPDLNERGRFRIDYEAAQPISTSRVEKQPWVLKTLSLGTWLDVELMDALTDPSLRTLDQRWRVWDPKELRMGEGFNRAPGSPQKYVDFLADLPVFEPPSDGFGIDYTALRTYGERYGVNKDGKVCANMPRRELLFQPPLVIVSRAPGDNPRAPRAFISIQPVAFSKSYYGYSCQDAPDGETLASLIFLVAHSTLFRYFALMVSVSIGADRMLLTKQDLGNFPFPDVSGFPGDTKATIRGLAKRIQRDVLGAWQEVDELVFGLYGLDKDAVQVAKDTLFAAASYRKAGAAALHRMTRETRSPFVNGLCEALDPYFDVCGEHAAVREAEFQPDTWREPWFFLALSRATDPVQVNAGLMRKAMEAANDHGCSRIIVHAPRKKGLLLGLLNQCRWWTATRARLCAQHIIRNHLDAFGLAERV